MASFEELLDDFDLLDDWEDRYKYVIELGRTLPDLGPDERSDANKVRGCASQVWIVSNAPDSSSGELVFRGDSDAHIVRGLIAILLALYSGKTPSAILKVDPEAAFSELGLREHLTAQRSNGLSSMVQRIKHDAERALLLAGSAS